MKVLVTGSQGQLGQSLLERFPKEWLVNAVTHGTLDITNANSVSSYVEQTKPDVIINCAAYTNVDRAEQEPDKAYLVNGEAAGILAATAAKYQSRFIHISTDYVFDGQSDHQYKESDRANPINVYGKSKYDGELAAFNVNKNTVILRTSWVFSEYGQNFVKTMLRLARERNSLNIVSDQVGCPTYAGHLAEAIIYLIEKKIGDGQLYHFCGDKSTNWYEFAKVIFRLARINNINVNAISSAEYKTLATRPAYSVLDCNKINKIGVRSSNWKLALEHILYRMM